MSLLHLLHHSRVETVLVNSASQVMGGEQDVDVVGVEHSRHVLVQELNVHLRRNRQGLDEEHRVLESDWVWLVVLLPNNLDWLGERGWDEALLGHDVHIQ